MMLHLVYLWLVSNTQMNPATANNAIGNSLSEMLFRFTGSQHRENGVGDVNLLQR